MRVDEEGEADEGGCAGIEVLMGLFGEEVFHTAGAGDAAPAERSRGEGSAFDWAEVESGIGRSEGRGPLRDGAVGFGAVGRSTICMSAPVPCA
jgi:hypothetical protein